LPRHLLKQKKVENNIEENIEKNFKDEKRKHFQLISKLDEKYYYDITLDPGRYDPNYNFVYKRIKNTLFDRPKTCIKNNNLNKNEKNAPHKEVLKIKKNKYKTLNITTNEKEKENRSKNKNKTKNKIKKDIILFNNNDHKTSGVKSFNFNFNAKKLKNKYKIKDLKKNLSISNSIGNINTLSRTLSPKININTNNNGNNLNHNFILKKTKNKKNRTFFSAFSSNMKKQKNNSEIEKKDEEEKKENGLNRCRSCTGACRGIISFDKMTGRDNIFNINNDVKNIYFPNYETIRPHLNIKKFNTKKSLQSFKKYAVGKIIRNYHFSPIDYFIFDINTRKEDVCNDNFLSFIGEKYKL
jgi:hypothetical protein